MARRKVRPRSDEILRAKLPKGTGEEVTCFTRLRGGRYEIVRFLGSGGFGAVFLGRDLWNGEREVAIKTVLVGSEHVLNRGHRTGSLDEVVLLQCDVLRAEIETLGRLRAEGFTSLPTVIETFDERSSELARDFADLKIDRPDALVPYLVMRFLPGILLERAIQDAKMGLGPRRTADVAQVVSRLLERLHLEKEWNGKVHRLFCDLKPSNIIVEDDGHRLTHVGIVDLGSVVLVRGKYPKRLLPGNALQDVQWLDVGVSEGYVAPECVHDQKVFELTRASDVFALGVVLAGCLTGYQPPSGSLSPDLERLAAALAPLGEDPVAAMVRRLIARDPSSRPVGGALVQAIDDAADRLAP